MKQLIIGFFALCSISVGATAAQTPTPPAAGESYLNIEKPQATPGNIEASLAKLQSQLDSNTKDIENFKNKFDIFELVKAYNQRRLQYTELEQRYIAQVRRSDSLSEQLSQQKTLMNDMSRAVSEFKASLVGADEKLVRLNDQIAQGEDAVGMLNATVALINNELPKLQEKNTTTSAMVNNVAEDAASKFKMVAIGFGIAVFFIAGFVFILRRRIDASGVHMEQKIRSTQKSMEEQTVSLDTKLIEVLDKQLVLSQEQKASVGTAQEAEPDHSLSLKVADEITRMQKNLLQLDTHAKGVKPLIKGLERIRKNFMANGYEIVDLLNKPFDDRMNIDVVNYVDDPNLEKKSKLIIKVIRPQVNFQGALIQRAQVDIAVN